MLPLVELASQFFSDTGLYADEVVLLGAVHLEIKELPKRLSIFLFVNDKLESSIDNRPSAQVVGVFNGGITEVLKVPRSDTAHQFDKRRGAFLQFEIDVGLGLGILDVPGIESPEIERIRAFGHLAIEQGNEIDSIDGTRWQRLPHNRTERRKQIAGAGPNLRATGSRNAGGPLDESGHENAAIVDRAFNAAMRSDERAIG